MDWQNKFTDAQYAISDLKSLESRNKLLEDKVNE